MHTQLECGLTKSELSEEDGSHESRLFWVGTGRVNAQRVVSIILKFLEDVTAYGFSAKG